jgi:hypothetical protein
MPLINAPIDPFFDTTVLTPADRASSLRRAVSKLVNISNGTDGNRRVSSRAASMHVGLKAREAIVANLTTCTGSLHLFERCTAGGAVAGRRTIGGR